MTHPAQLLIIAIVAAWATALVLLRPSGRALAPPVEPALARLNRLAAENKELVEAVGKIVVPVVLVVLTLMGVHGLVDRIQQAVAEPLAGQH